EPQALSALHTLLDSWGWRVLGARDAAAALALVRDAPPDLAILDYHLDGGRTGLELYTMLRDALGELPTVLLTADRDTALRNQVQALGLVLLYKPLKPLALHQVLRQVLGAAVA